MKRSRYKSLDIKRELDIVESAPPGKKKKDIALEVGIPPSTLTTILKNKATLRGQTLGNKKKKRNHNPSRPDVDKALFSWFLAARANSVPVSGDILKSKAEEFAEQLDSEDTDGDKWVCSNGWISRWKVRHNIKYKTVCGENASVDMETCANWKQSVLMPTLKCYRTDDVYNADETGLYWRVLPNKMHAIAGEICTGDKKSKERVTILVCTNMSGSNKCPLLTIGKFRHPRCFNGVRCLPTQYEANKSAWMTSSIFEEWLKKWDAELTKTARNIVLFIDNCSAHPHVQGLQSIQVVFLPPNATSELQPCDQGIIKALKSHYRKIMIKI